MTPESQILKAVTDLLSAERIWHERRNTGAMREGKRFVKFSRPGTADIFATPLIGGRPHPVWIECKAPKGRQSEAQKNFQCEVEMAGHDYLLAYSSDDVLAWLKRAR
jgi:hypothetical protein